MLKYLISACLLATLFAPASFAASSLEPALDDRGNAVLDRRGNCVRTHWMSGDDPCNPTVAEPEPAPVVAAPAPVAKTIASQNERTVYFDFDSSALDMEAKGKLNELAQKINAHNAITSVYMVGYTDQFGSVAYNQALSERRVNAVRSYLNPLITLNIDPSSAQFLAAGEAPSDGECEKLGSRQAKIDCMRTQRRTEVRFTTQDTRMVPGTR